MSSQVKNLISGYRARASKLRVKALRDVNPRLVSVADRYDARAAQLEATFGTVLSESEIPQTSGDADSTV